MQKNGKRDAKYTEVSQIIHMLVNYYDAANGLQYSIKEKNQYIFRDHCTCKKIGKMPSTPRFHWFFTCIGVARSAIKRRFPQEI